MSNDNIIKNQNNNINTNYVSNEKNKNYDKNENFIDFINHLLTFNKQQELLQKQMQTGNNDNSKILPFRFNINARVIIKLCDIVLSIFQNEPNILYLEAPIYIFGDIHGQFSDMIHFLEMTGLPPNNRLLFMGDYVDRGNNSIEVCVLLFALKIKFPNCIQVLRGNHECPDINKMYGLLGECETRFGNDANIIFNKINQVLCSLPLCAIINNKIFCVHGGISPHLKKIEDIVLINRFCKIPDSGLLCDLLWSDPTTSSDKWGINSRGVSCTYNAESISIFLKINKLQLLCRAHQLVAEGYKFFANNKLVTVFSAPNYCGNCGNDGAVMKISENLECSFIIIKPTNEQDKNKGNIINKRNRIIDKIDY